MLGRRRRGPLCGREGVGSGGGGRDREEEGERGGEIWGGREGGFGTVERGTKGVHLPRTFVDIVFQCRNAGFVLVGHVEGLFQLALTRRHAPLENLDFVAYSLTLELPELGLAHADLWCYVMSDHSLGDQ